MTLNITAYAANTLQNKQNNKSQTSFGSMNVIKLQPVKREGQMLLEPIADRVSILQESQTLSNLRDRLINFRVKPTGLRIPIDLTPAKGNEAAQSALVRKAFKQYGIKEARESGFGDLIFKLERNDGSKVLAKSTENGLEEVIIDKMANGIKSFRQTMYGKYECVLQNPKGHDEFLAVRLGAKTRSGRQAAGTTLELGQMKQGRLVDGISIEEDSPDRFINPKLDKNLSVQEFNNLKIKINKTLHQIAKYIEDTVIASTK